MPTLVFANYVLREAQTFHNASFECAAWWEDIAVEPGEYEARGDFEGSKLKWAHVKLPGIVVGSYFPSMFAGVGYGTNPRDAERVGTPGSYSKSCVYGYGIAQDIVQRPHRSPWVLNPGFIVVPAGYDNEQTIYRSDHTKFKVATPAYHVVKEA